jgi:helicase MOV-10
LHGGLTKLEERTLKAAELKNNRATIEADKGKLEVSAVSFDGIIPIGQEVIKTLVIRNTGKKARHFTAKLLSSGEESSATATFQLNSKADGFVLKANRTVSLTINAQAKAPGLHKDILTLSFGGFSIGRFLELRAGDENLYELLKPTAPYKPAQRKRKKLTAVEIGKEDDTKIVRAPRGGSSAPLNVDKNAPKLGQYSLGSSGWHTLTRDDMELQLLEGYGRMTSPTLRREEHRSHILWMYRNHQSRLLYTEEIQLLADLATFDFVDEQATSLAPARGLLWLTVPGLAERRPSVLKGDKVQITRPSDGKRFEGVAMMIQANQVGLKFSPAFTNSYTNGLSVDVHFVLGRAPLRLFHQGIDVAYMHNMSVSLLFPEKNDIPLVSTWTDRPIEPFRTSPAFNRSLNAEQRRAVENIISGASRAVPYIIFGPPGTGKTTTVVEVVLQAAVHLRRRLERNGKDFKILVCAPTNTAADYLCSKLARSLASKRELMRLMAYSRNYADVPEDIKPYTNWNAVEESFSLPTLSEIKEPDVVISTLTNAGRLHNIGKIFILLACVSDLTVKILYTRTDRSMVFNTSRFVKFTLDSRFVCLCVCAGLPRGHFDMIVVDEAGQALEPEVMAAVGCLLSASGQLVLAGDPKQVCANAIVEAYSHLIHMYVFTYEINR